MSVSYGGSSITFEDGSIVSSGSAGFKNKIINGAMMIDQRNAGASVTATGSNYSLDRWQMLASVSSKFTVQQSSTAPSGFTKSLLVTSSAATSLGATDYYLITQKIEGFNTADLGWGAAGASSITVSFWVRSSLTGTFGFVVRNSAGNRLYPASYTISSANTFEYKTVTIAGDTTGTWSTDNSIGIELDFGLGVGSTYSNTAGTWTTGGLGVTGATSVVGTSGATFYITGVQLEKGTTASSFEFRSYTKELMLCQRYFQKFENISGGEATGSLATGTVWTSTNFFTVVPYITTMRALPTGTSSGSTAITLLVNGAAKQSSAITIQQFSKQAFEIVGTSSSMTGGQAGFTRFTGSTDYIALSAEL